MPFGYTKEQVEQIKQQALLFWQKAGQAHSSFYTNVTDRLRMAHGLLPTDLARRYAAHNDKSALAPPDIYINIESLRAAIHNLIFGYKPWGQVSVFGSPGNRSELCQKAEGLLQHMNDLSNEGRGESSALDPVIHQALYSGLGCTFTRWQTKRVRIVERDSRGIPVVDKKKNLRFRLDEVVQYPEVVPIDIRRVRFDPKVDRLKDVTMVGHHYMGSLFKLLGLNRHKKHFYDFDEKELKNSYFSRQHFYEHVPGESDQFPEKGMENDFGDKIIEVKTIRGLFRIKTGHTYYWEDLVVDLGNDKILGIKKNDLPLPGWKLYNTCAVDNELGRFFPMGVVEPTEDTWITLFLTMNNLIDRNNRDTYKMYYGDKAAIQHLDEQVTYEDGKIVTVDTVAAGIQRVQDAFGEMGSTNPPQANFPIISQLQEQIKQIMRLSDYIRGTDPARAETATAVTALVRGGQSLLMHMVDKVCESLLQPLWQQKLILHNHFMGHQNYQIRGEDNQLMNIAPGELNAYWQISIDTNASQDRPEMVRRVVESFMMLYPLPEVERRELVKNFFEIIKYPNKEKVLVSDERVKSIAQRENLSMIGGVEMPVHPMDHHQGHIPIHEPLLNAPDRAIANMAQNHIDAHITEMEKQNKGQLANTREVGIGQESTGNLPSQKKVPRVNLQ